jgi:hypothetical protein
LLLSDIPLAISHSRNYGGYADYRSLHLNKHWEEALRWSLSRPVTRSQTILNTEDLCMSEGKGDAEMLMEFSVRQTKQLIHLMALLEADDGSEDDFAEADPEDVKEKEKALHVSLAAQLKSRASVHFMFHHRRNSP